MLFKPQHEFIHLLADSGVPYCLVGGHAVQAHGYARETEDIDLVWQRSGESELRLFDLLQTVHANWISNDRDPETGLERLVPISLPYVHSEHLMMLWTDYGFLDLFDYIPGFPQEDVNELIKTSIPLAGARYASLEWLKRMKRAAARSKDLADLEQLP